MANRKTIQSLTALLYNANLSGFFKGTIWKGASKTLCVPGLNCYSCPGALGSCPLGSLQASLASSVIRFPFYVLGLLLLFGLLLGRLICGWFCPFGLIQELLYKIPSPKLKKNKLTQRLTSLKYLIGIVFVLLLPLFWRTYGAGSPTFCKFICPAGTLEAAVPLLALNPALRRTLGWIFSWKFAIMLVTIVASIFIYRPFCRFICPLGAWYGLFNKLSFFGIKIDPAKCTGCNSCLRHCKMDCQSVGDPECINCGECTQSCPTQAIMIQRKH